MVYIRTYYVRTRWPAVRVAVVWHWCGCGVRSACLCVWVCGVGLRDFDGAYILALPFHALLTCVLTDIRMYVRYSLANRDLILGDKYTETETYLAD